MSGQNNSWLIHKISLKVKMTERRYAAGKVRTIPRLKKIRLVNQCWVNVPLVFVNKESPGPESREPESSAIGSLKNG